MILDYPGTAGIVMVRCTGTNCYLIALEEGVMVVDAGWHSGVPAILEALSENGFHPEDVRLVVLTHAHFDHFGFARQLKERTGARTAAHRADVPYFERGGAGFFPAHLAARFSSQNQLVRQWFHAPAVGIDVVVDHGDVLGDWRVCHTPGHTPGTISLYAENRQVLITGGWAIPRKKQRQNHPGKMSPVGYLSVDPAQVLESRRYLAGLDFQTLLCSHFRPQFFPLFKQRLQALVP